MRARAFWAGLTLLAASAPVGAQSSADEQARRLLEDGKDYFGKGRYKQALDNFNTIVSGFATTDSVDDALLEIGRYHLEVENDPAKARESFELVAQRYPQSDGAPGAYYYLGWLTMTRATTAAELDDALAQLDRLRTLYPRSDWVPRAFYATGLVHRKAGRLPQAVDAERRAALEYPTSEAAPAAQFQIGHCLALMGEPRLAMEEYQRVRNRYPESEWSARALDRITALYRLHGGAAPTFAVDPAFVVNGGDVLKDVRAILMDRAGMLWVASEHAKGAVPFDAAGKMGPSVTAEDIRGLALTPKGDLVTAARLAVRFGPKDLKSFVVPTDKGVPDPLEKITAAVVTQGGSILIADDKKHRVYRYDAQFAYKGTFPDAKEHSIARMTTDGEGGIVLLDGDEHTVKVYDETGKLLRSIGGKGTAPELKHAVDVTIDASLNYYVADEEAGVYVVSPAGKLITTVTAEAARKPKAVSLDAAGAILVYDDKTQRIVRFR